MDTLLVALLDLGYLHPHSWVVFELGRSHVVYGQGRLELRTQPLLYQDLLLLLLLASQLGQQLRVPRQLFLRVLSQLLEDPHLLEVGFWVRGGILLVI